MKPQDGPAADAKEGCHDHQEQGLLLSPRPTYRLCRVTGDGEALQWTPLDRCDRTRTAKGFNLNFDAVPLIERTFCGLRGHGFDSE